jgi:flagellar motor switch protein FliM
MNVVVYVDLEVKVHTTIGQLKLGIPAKIHRSQLINASVAVASKKPTAIQSSLILASVPACD